MKKIILTTTFLSFMASAVYSGGFELTEYSATGMGRGFSGGGVSSDDYSNVILNPAGMVLKGSGLQAVHSIVHLHTDVKGQVSAGGSPISSGESHMSYTAHLPSFVGQYQPEFNQDLRFGLAVFAPFGLETPYKEDWFAKNEATKSRFEAIDIAPSMAYQINDKWSVGASAIVQYVKARLASNLSQVHAQADYNVLKGDTINYGYTLGIMYRPQKETRIGLSYRSYINNNIDAESHTRLKSAFGGITLIKDVYAKIQTPERITLGIAHDLTDKLTLSSTIRYTHWSRFSDLNIYEENGTPVSFTKENWENSWYLSLGADYKIDANWIVRAGVAWDQSPIQGEKYRTARIPDNDRIWTSVGFSYINGPWQFDVAGAYGFIEDFNSNNQAYSTTGSPTTLYQAKYDANIVMASFGVQYNF